jgi:hypothetical protein
MEVTSDVKLVLTIYTTATLRPDVGVNSVYAEVPHPGTGKKIEGWKWDERTWSETLELKANDYVPTIFDPDINFVDEDKFQSGIGDNHDLKLLQVKEQRIEDVEYWVPRLHHGHFYNFDQEWYLYSDDVRKDVVDSGVLLSGVLQWDDMTFKPKPGIPISVRRYKWDRNQSRYEVDLALRKVQDFTGIVISDEEQETRAGSDFIIANIDTTKEEFVVEIEDADGEPRTTPRVVFNQLFTESIGVSGNLDSLERIGISDGRTNEYHLTYSPVDLTQPFYLISWDPSTSGTASWGMIDSVSGFATGPFHEFKLDPYLGIITFGDYDSSTQSGAGYVPDPRHFIGAAYSYGVDITYEPAKTRDWVEPLQSDVNPLHNASHQGFIEVSPNLESLFNVHLFADLVGSAAEGYIIEQGSKLGKISARVRDIQGNELEGQTVEFEVLNPEFGTFANGRISDRSITNHNGLASVFYKTPAIIEEASHVVDVIAPDAGSSTTLLSISNMVAPLSLESITHYLVRADDQVGGMPATTSGLSYWDDYVEKEEFEEDPNGAAASAGYEELYRDGRDLPEPTFTDITDLLTGTKVVVSAVDVGVLDPNYAVQKSTTLAPLIPFSASTVGSNEDPVLELEYSGLLTQPDGSSFKSYVVVADPLTRLRAKVTNQVSGRVSYSNVIVLNLQSTESAQGTLIARRSEDIEADLLWRPKNIYNYQTITSGDMAPNRAGWGHVVEEYLEDRILERTLTYVTWSGDSNTIGYWPFDGHLQDQSSYANHAHAVGNMKSEPFSGLVDGAFRSNGGFAYVNAPGLYNDINLTSGTIDFAFRSTQNTPSGVEFKMMQITATGINGLRNNLEIRYLPAAGSSGTRIRMEYEVSGVGNGPRAYLDEELDNNGITICDGEWHTFRFQWDYQSSDYTTGTVHLTGRIDNRAITSGHRSALLPFGLTPGITQGGILTAIVGDLTSLNNLWFDEVRYSDMLRADCWPASGETIYEESFSDWWKRTNRGNTVDWGLLDVVLSGNLPARVPIGFRLKDSGITVASNLDKSTYLTLNNPLPDTYFSEVLDD